MGTGTIKIYFQNSYEPTSIVGFLTCHMAPINGSLIKWLLIITIKVVTGKFTRNWRLSLYNIVVSRDVKYLISILDIGMFGLMLDRRILFMPISQPKGMLYKHQLT